MTNRSLLAGDPIAYAGAKLEEGRDPHPHACYEGIVFIGEMVESKHDLDGEIVEHVRLPCRRCAEEERR